MLPVFCSDTHAESSVFMMWLVGREASMCSLLQEKTHINTRRMEREPSLLVSFPPSFLGTSLLDGLFKQAFYLVGNDREWCFGTQVQLMPLSTPPNM